MYVIGTAGHVDHGKSSLVKAMTGIDPDRLQEEKLRELTIDLGYAWFDLPDHKNVSIVDVPGHEKFINNMLAGVGSIDMALLVVAADESVMHQTREHVAILELLKINIGMVAITKVDLVSQAMVDLVIEDVKGLLKGTFMENAAIVSVSSITGQGVDDLKTSMNKNLSSIRSPRDISQARLLIDRAFTITGFGTIVTGNLRDGSLKVGEQVEIVNSGKQSRIRGLQIHGAKVTQAMPGTRVAANLSGIPTDYVNRGDVLAPVGIFSATTAFDIYLKVIKDIPNNLKHNMYVNVHLGAAQQVGKLRLLDRDIAEPGEEVWAQIKLTSKFVVQKNDHCIIRANQITLGGGVIVESHAKRHRRNHNKTISMLNLKKAGSTDDLILLATNKISPVKFEHISTETDLSRKEIQVGLTSLIESKQIIDFGPAPNVYYQTVQKWTDTTRKIEDELSNYHNKFPAKTGIAKNQLNKSFHFSNKIVDVILIALSKSGSIVIENGQIRLSNHEPKLSSSEKNEAEAFLLMLRENRYSPPTNSTPEAHITDILIARGEIIKISNQIFYDNDTYETMLIKIIDFVKKHGEINISEIKDLFKISRKYALAFAEHLDQKQVTRRIGDSRILRQKKSN